MKTRPGNRKQLTLPSRLAQAGYRTLDRFPWLPSQHRYNMTISHAGAFIWFRVAKVCTRSIFGLLQQSGLPLDVEHPSWLHYPPRAMAHYFKFAFVRNPWDRLVSCWHNKVVDSNAFGLPEAQHAELQDFARFVEYVASLDLQRCDRHLRLQSALIDLNAVDFIGRFERFEADFAQVAQRLHIDPAALEVRNASTRSDYRQYYDTALAARVGELYRRDCCLFGYGFGTA